MSAIEISVRDNLGEVQERIRLAVDNLQRFDRPAPGKRRSLWDRVGAHWRTSRRQMFATAGRSTGTPWADYTAEEAQYRVIKSSIFGRLVGRSTGDLNRWMPGRERLYPSMVSRTHPEYVQIEGPRRITLGTRVPYAVDLHLGRGRAPAHLGGGGRPARPLLALGNPFRRSVRVATAEFAADHTAAIGDTLGRSMSLRERR